MSTTSCWQGHVEYYPRLLRWPATKRKSSNKQQNPPGNSNKPVKKRRFGNGNYILTMVLATLLNWNGKLEYSLEY
eukprot:scaffold596_cov87-Cylindrotheca_fusiformis.AAC.3